jgi:RND family efflux transporter MFP subunit
MLLRLLIPVVILALGALAAWRLGIPVEAPKPQPAPPQVLKTEILELQRTDFTVLLDSQGSVRAHYTTTITPQVAGNIIKIHDGFEDGAFFAKDDVLAELDPADFQVAVSAAESRLARAEAVLVQEEARAKQARLNWEDLGYDEEPSELVLRIPQLKEARATVDAAKADLEQAMRNLERTKIRAPFDGRVQQRTVGLGQAVGGGPPPGSRCPRGNSISSPCPRKPATRRCR